MDRKSIHAAAEQEATLFRWIESDKAGADLGGGAIRQWVREYYPGFVRAAWIEHIQGRRFWIELDRDQFGLKDRKFSQHPILFDRILDRLMAGRENLDIIVWAKNWGIPLDPVVEILETLDMNSRRLLHRVESQPVLAGDLPLRLEPDWLSWNDWTVTHLAWSIALNRDFTALPILGDALEDAGCEDLVILESCRVGGNTCWPRVVLAILELSWPHRIGQRPVRN